MNKRQQSFALVPVPLNKIPNLQNRKVKVRLQLRLQNFQGLTVHPPKTERLSYAAQQPHMAFKEKSCTLGVGSPSLS